MMLGGYVWFSLSYRSPLVFAVRDTELKIPPGLKESWEDAKSLAITAKIQSLARYETKSKCGL